MVNLWLKFHGKSKRQLSRNGAASVQQYNNNCKILLTFWLVGKYGDQQPKQELEHGVFLTDHNQMIRHEYNVPFSHQTVIISTSLFSSH